MKTIIALGITAIVASGALADPVVCEKQMVKQLAKLKKVAAKAIGRCVDKENKGTIPGPCPDLVADAKIQKTRDKARDVIALNCSLTDMAALEFSLDCNLDVPDSAAENACAALPVTSPAEFADCLACWKEARVSHYAAFLYASHAVEVCGGDATGASTVCSSLQCAHPPLPDQRDLGDTGENDCQRAIGKAGIKYLLSREKLLEKCALAGGTEASCDADVALALKLDKARAKVSVLIENKCGNRDPVANPPFCCKTTGNNCMAAADRETCETNGGQVQEGKVCGVGNTCDPQPGNQQITWWEKCAQLVSASCTGAALVTQEDLIACVGDNAELVVQRLLCYQFRGGSEWPCPTSPSGAFLE
jgi:hypothetical protein